MAEQFLDGADIVPGLEEVGREAMSERMTTGVLDNTGGADRPLDGFLQGRRGQVVSPDDPGAGVGRSPAGGEQVLPAELKSTFPHSRRRPTPAPSEATIPRVWPWRRPAWRHPGPGCSHRRRQQRFDDGPFGVGQVAGIRLAAGGVHGKHPGLRDQGPAVVNPVPRP